MYVKYKYYNNNSTPIEYGLEMPRIKHKGHRIKLYCLHEIVLPSCLEPLLMKPICNLLVFLGYFGGYELHHLLLEIVIEFLIAR